MATQVHDDTTLTIPVTGASLTGELSIPAQARGLVLFAHGSGSSRKSARNRFVAQQLARRRLGTLLFDLLTDSEEREDALTAALRFDIALLASRLGEATDWLALQQGGRLGLGYFGASTGAAAALVAAALRPGRIQAVVSRGGRPDLAREYLSRVTAPTLLIVGSLDTGVADLNQQALAQLPGERRLAIVDGATHLFEEPGALDNVAQLAGDWFVEHLQPAHPGA